MVSAIFLVQTPGGPAQSGKVVMGFTLPLSGFLAALAGILIRRWDSGDGASEVTLFKKRVGSVLLVEGITILLTAIAWYTVSGMLPITPFVVLLVGNLVLMVTLFSSGRSGRPSRSELDELDEAINSDSP